MQKYENIQICKIWMQFEHGDKIEAALPDKDMRSSSSFFFITLEPRVE